jgi:hypothetical protein
MQVIGMALGEEKHFMIDPNASTNGSSHPSPTRDEELVFEVGEDQLPDDGREVGKTLLVNTSQGGSFHAFPPYHLNHNLGHQGRDQLSLLLSKKEWPN